MSDTFISVGHTPETDACVKIIAETLESKDLSVWWDKNAKKGIVAGASWTSEINQAMRYGNFDIGFGPFLMLSSATHHPHTRRVTFSTSRPR